jgi:hypothetical protein
MPAGKGEPVKNLSIVWKIAALFAAFTSGCWIGAIACAQHLWQELGVLRAITTFPAIVWEFSYAAFQAWIPFGLLFTAFALAIVFDQVLLALRSIRTRHAGPSGEAASTGASWQAEHKPPESGRSARGLQFPPL